MRQGTFLTFVFITQAVLLTCQSGERTFLKKPNLYNLSKKSQYLISVLAVMGVGALGLLFYNLIDYRIVAFLLLVTVSILAMFLDIVPVIIAAFLSALLWDFLFIPPRFTFTVGTTEDRILLLMYLLIVVIHAVLTFRIRKAEKEIRLKEEKANEAKFYNTLFNSLSHELRTPITTILGSTDNLINHASNLSTETNQELLQEIATASLRLNRQVENLLNMSRLESGAFKIKKDWCNIEELVYTVIKQVEPGLLKHKITVHIPEALPLFKLDFGLMEQVLYNLLNNAIQYTPEETTVMIGADCIDEKLILTVADNGKGFPENEIDNVFTKFYRLKGSRPGGTGLGLSIAKGFVEAHNGTISLKSLPLSGALFTIEISTEMSYLNGLKNE
jgi:two-component system, OmpR family, sensor histidine kinase KdpD